MHASNIYRFDHYRMDCKNWTLYRGDEVLELPPKVVDVLICLLKHAGDTVSHEELMRAVWPGLVVDHGALKHAISIIRSTLGDEPPYRFIETVKGRGYRFIHAVAVERNAEDAEDQRSAPSTELSSSRNDITAFAISLIAALVLIGVACLPRITRPVFEAKQITTQSPQIPVIAVALSPSGNKLAFADKTGLYVGDPHGIERHRVPLPDGVVTTDLQWFPDDFHLLLTTASEGLSLSTLWKIAVVGGEQKQLLTDVSLAAPSPDGKLVTFIRNDDELWIANAEGNNARLLFKSSSNVLISLGTRITPDGSSVAVNLIDRSSGTSQIQLVRIEDGSVSTLMKADYDIIDFAFLNNSELLISKLPKVIMSETELIVVKPDRHADSSHSQSHHAYSWPDMESYSLNATRDGDLVALINMKMSSRIFVGELDDSGNAFTNIKTLNNPEYESAPAEWLADSRTLIFVSSNHGRHSINAQSVDSTHIKELVNDEYDNKDPAVTADQRWLFYFSSVVNRDPSDSTMRLMKKPLSGGKAIAIDTRDDALWRLHCAATALRCVVAENNGDETTFFNFDVDRGKGETLYSVKWGEADTFYEWDVSPDGSAIAYVNVSSAPTDIHIVTLRN
ncbi:MAG TPA: winged helix-turn-helix domain-containing protein, partial [Steroidobacteraceae bacterium]|nr:winged helix-turn-helix domain-containing protein [Steroidobacteraceae bacterium]